MVTDALCPDGRDGGGKDRMEIHERQRDRSIRLDARWQGVDVCAFTKSEPQDVHVHQLLAPRGLGVHDERDLALVPNSILGNVPGKRPNPLGAAGVFDPTDPHTRERKARDERRGTAARFHVLDGDELRVTRPDDVAVASVWVIATGIRERKAFAGHRTAIIKVSLPTMPKRPRAQTPGRWFTTCAYAAFVKDSAPGTLRARYPSGGPAQHLEVWLHRVDRMASEDEGSRAPGRGQILGVRSLCRPAY